MSKTNQLLQWTNKYSVSDAAIDEEQKKMFDLFNELLSGCHDDEPDKNLPALINALNDQSKLLFSTEEKILKSNGYPDYETHVKEHRKFTRAAIELRRRLADTPDSIEQKDIMRLKDILITHMETTDQLFVPFLRIKAHIRDQKK